jgi:hypothetical protein
LRSVSERHLLALPSRVGEVAPVPTRHRARRDRMLR